jgi:hypothetical protein
VTSMKGESDQMPVDTAVEMIHATPPEDRSHFAREIWRLRRTGHERLALAGPSPF